MTRKAGETAHRERWIEAGLVQLAGGGVERVRIEVLAKDLAVTKGGFYWHFRDRDALLSAMLAHWRDGRAAAIERQSAEAGTNPRERLLGLVKLYSKSVHAQGLAIELAIRHWAASSAEAATAVAAVDAARLKSVRSLYEAAGCAPGDAQARAFLFYSFVFGQSLLIPEGSERRRRELVAACAERIAAVDEDKAGG